MGYCGGRILWAAKSYSRPFGGEAGDRLVLCAALLLGVASWLSECDVGRNRLVLREVADAA